MTAAVQRRTQRLTVRRRPAHKLADLLVFVFKINFMCFCVIKPAK